MLKDEVVDAVEGRDGDLLKREVWRIVSSVYCEMVRLCRVRRYSRADRARSGLDMVVVNSWRSELSENGLAKTATEVTCL